MKILAKNILGLVMIGTILFSLYILPLLLIIVSPFTIEKLEFIIVFLIGTLIFYFGYKEKKYAGIIGTIIFGTLSILTIINLGFNIRTTIYIINFIASVYYTITFYKNS